PHEAGETLLGVGDDGLPAAHGLGNLDSGRVETIADHPDMSRRSDDDRSPAVPQAGSKKVGDGAAEKLLIGIELHDVIAGVWCAEQAFPRLRRTQRRGWRSHPDCEQPPTNLQTLCLPCFSVVQEAKVFTLTHPRPTNGIFVAITVRNCTLASRGRLAM